MYKFTNSFPILINGDKCSMDTGAAYGFGIGDGCPANDGTGRLLDYMTEQLQDGTGFGNGYCDGDCNSFGECFSRSLI